MFLHSSEPRLILKEGSWTLSECAFYSIYKSSFNPIQWTKQIFPTVLSQSQMSKENRQCFWPVGVYTGDQYHQQTHWATDVEGKVTLTLIRIANPWTPKYLSAQVLGWPASGSDVAMHLPSEAQKDLERRCPGRYCHAKGLMSPGCPAHLNIYWSQGDPPDRWPAEFPNW